MQITISREAHATLRRAQDLLRHAIPDGNPAVIFERALTLLVESLERTRMAVTKRPRGSVTQKPRSRHVPAAVKREVWARDGGRCAFVGTMGRCVERGFLELHHVIPFADGGATDAANLQLRCAAHNAYEAEEWFGPLIAREERAAYGQLGPDRVDRNPRAFADSAARLADSMRKPRARAVAAGAAGLGRSVDVRRVGVISRTHLNQLLSGG